MADSVQEILDVPKEFVKDGTQFIKRCQKRTSRSWLLAPGSHPLLSGATDLW